MTTSCPPHRPLCRRLPLLQSALQRLQSALALADGDVKQAMFDYKAQPAVSLLPDVSYQGLSAAEWLSAIQDLHAQIRGMRDRVREGGRGGP